MAVGLAIAAIVGGVAPVLSALVSGWLVTSLIRATQTGLNSSAEHEAVVAVIILAFTFVLSQNATRISTTIATTAGNRIDAALQQRSMLAVNRPAGIAHLDDPKMRNLLARVSGVGSGGYTPGTAVSGLATKVRQGAQAAAAVIVVAFFHWWLALVLITANLWWSYQSQRDFVAQTQTMAQQTTLLRKSGYFRDLVLTPPAAKEIRIFGLPDWLVGRFQAEWDSAMAKVWASRGQRRLASLGAITAVTAANFAVFGFLGWDSTHHSISIGALVVFARATALVGGINNRGAQDLQLKYGLLALPAIASVEKSAAAIVALSGTAPPALPAGSAITFHDVRFGYPGAKSPVLDGLNLDIPVGKSTAIVGLNGAGKTTLIKLLCRFYDPDSGEITVNGQDLRGIDAQQWQGKFAAVFQDFIQYELPVYDNISLGAIGLKDDADAIERAAKRAGIFEHVKGLPAGMATPLSRQIKGGTGLSEGQWQRVALARALLAMESGAEILILDEPTARLDARAEARFYDEFLGLTQGVTSIVISHRFAAVRQADRICVLENGRVGELGSHSELLKRDGKYAQMFHAQADRFSTTSGSPA